MASNDAIPNLRNLLANDEGLQQLKANLLDNLKGAVQGLTTDAVGSFVDPINPKSPLSTSSLRELTGQAPQEHDSDASKLGNVLSGVLGAAAGKLAAAGGAKVLSLLAGIFAGPKAKTFPHAAAALFKEIEASAPSALRDNQLAQLFTDSKIFRSPGDKQLRQEIPDIGAKLRDMSIGEKPLKDVLDHPGLFKAYPELQNLPVEVANMDRTIGGAFNPIYGITLNREGPGPLSTLLHEVQHAIQHREGFARGGNAAMFDPKSAEALQVGQELKARNITPDEETIRNILYRRLSGEAEARAVQNRLADAELGQKIEEVKSGTSDFKDMYGVSPEHPGFGYDVLLRNLINKYW